MNSEGAFLLGNGTITRIEGQRGETPPVPNALFKRGDVVAIRNLRSLKSFPREAVVAVAIPPGFSPDWALADLLGKPRPLMCQVGARSITYILVREGDQRPYLVRESALKPSGKDPVEIGSVRSADEGDAP